ncbi:MAG TPA: hypothetical protein VEA69_21235 [Tepidisphaeraceae bacterium]|nr:hypothetical protein [Tepidisphaeraceae bacterium]
MQASHLLTDTDFKRVARATRRVEQQLIGDRGDSRRVPAEGNAVQVLQIQAGDPDDFGYPARIQQWDDSDGTFSDLDTTEVRIADPIGSGFAVGDYIPHARFVGFNGDGVGCFVSSVGSVGGGLSSGTSTSSGAAVYSSTYQDVTGPGYGYIVSEYDTVVYDTDNYYNAAENRFEITEAGYYLIGASRGCSFVPPFGTDLTGGLVLIRNGYDEGGGYEFNGDKLASGPTAYSGGIAHVNVVAYLEEGDYVHCGLFVPASNEIRWEASGHDPTPPSSGNPKQFWIHRLSGGPQGPQGPQGESGELTVGGTNNGEILINNGGVVGGTTTIDGGTW